MADRMSRRQMIMGSAAGLVAGTGIDAADAAVKPPYSQGLGWQGTGWTRGPDTTLVKNQKPGTTPVRLACSWTETRLWYPEKGTITEAVKKIRDLGYTSTGVAHGPFKRDKWLDATDSEIRELKAALKQYDVVFFDHMTWDNIIHPDASYREKAIRHVIESLEAAEKTGALSVCAGLGTRDPDPDCGLAMNPENWTAETWKLGVDGIKQILKSTAGYKAVLGMEAVVTTPLDGPMALKKLQDDVGDPRCQVALDPANMFTIANYYHSTEMINWCFDVLGESIVCCHAKDTFIERNEMLVLMTMKPAGKGVQDYETYLTRLSQMKWPRTLLLEFAQPEEYPAAKAYVMEKAQKAGVKIYGA